VLIPPDISCVNDMPSPERLTASQLQVRFLSRCRFASTIVIITIIA